MTQNPLQPRPTKIISQPYKVLVNGIWTWMVETDIGLFTAQALAKLIGFEHHHGFTQRLRKFPYTAPGILSPPAPRGWRITGETTDMSSGDFGTEEWQALGDKPRTRNLAKIRPLGEWEARQL